MTGISTQKLLELFLDSDEGVIVLRFGEAISLFAENDLSGAIELLQRAIDLTEEHTVKSRAQ